MSSINEMRLPSQHRSELAQRLLYLDGKPFSLTDYPFFPAIYDGLYQGLLLKCGRQVAKSTTLCNFTISESIGMPHFKTLFVSPSQEQTQRFSNTRLAKVVHYSPLIRRHFITREFSDRTMLRMFANGSEVALSYACDNPDRARGVSADRLCWDEIQDILYDPVVPVVNECFDADTEVLTRGGWKSVCAITQKDQLADVDDDGVIHWHQPTRVIKTAHTGTMYTFTHQGMRLRVTNRHMMWAHLHGETRYAHKGQFEFITAEDLWDAPGESFRFTGPAATTATTAPTHRYFPGISTAHGANRRGISIPYKSLARFIGWYLAEGSIIWTRKDGKRSCPRPCITQSEERHLDDVLQTIDACGLTYNVETNSKKPHVKRVIVNSRLLGEYLLPLGKTADKYIPEEFFAYPSLLEQLIETLYLGDASPGGGSTWDTWMLYTTAPRLADGVHRAWTLLGRSPRLRQRKTLTKSGLAQYEVCAYKKNFFIFHRRDSEQRVSIDDVRDEPVYCFTLPYHRPVVRGGFGQRPIVTSQCMGNSEYGYETYAGTPKTLENTIEYLWSISTKTEWIMKCEGCGSWSFIESAKAIGKAGPVCIKCDHLLNPRAGRWYDFNPGSTLKGFHISQPMLPRNMESTTRWQRILDKLERYSETKFKNEVLGISDALGARIIGKGELEDLCLDYDLYRTPPPGILTNNKGVVAGIDWSGGGTEGVSRTVLWIWGITPENRLRTLYFRIYPVTSPVSIIDDVVEVLAAYSVKLVIGDRGEGHLANDLVANKLGKHRVHQVHYGNQATPLSWNDKGQFYTADRTTLMDNFFMVLKRQGVEYPRLQYMGEAIQDVLNIYEEVTNTGKKVWRHAPTQPDDAFHAQLFGWLAAKIVMMDLNFSG